MGPNLFLLHYSDFSKSSTYFCFKKARDQRGPVMVHTAADLGIPVISEMKRQPSVKITVAISFVLLQANRAQHS